LAEKEASRIDQELVKALGHPLRVRVLEALQNRVASPSELAKEMDQSLGLISYHTNTLLECDCLELVHTRPRRGAIEHFYRAKPRSFIGHQDWRRAPLSVRDRVTAAAVGSFLDRAAAAIEADTIDSREETRLSWMPIAVDDTGRREVAAILDEAAKQLTAVHDRSVKRLGGSPGIPVIVGLAGFEAGGAASPGD
jgi:DNA-binding transcriptional ArsR family regulator